MGKGKTEYATLQQAILHFSDYENCRRFMVALRWPDGVKCPNCGSEKVTYLEKARLWKCYGKHERPKFSLKTGTIFEDSPIGLEKWLPVMWMLVNCKNGVSSWEIHRAMGVTQKTAWFMLQRARLALQDQLTGGNLGGEVEIDETFIGAKARNMHKDRRIRAHGNGPMKGKSVVFGMLERGGKIRAGVVPDRSKASIKPLVDANIDRGSQLYTDEHTVGWWREDEFLHPSREPLVRVCRWQLPHKRP